MPHLAQLKTELAALSDDDFELLVFQLIEKEHQTAEHLAAPDGGADIVVPAGGRQNWVIQVKHYPSTIRWNHCVDSLNRALAAHNPSRITFVFSSDLTLKSRRAFASNLSDAAPDDVPVDYKGLSWLLSQLDSHPDVASRFLTRIHNDALRSATRTIAAGGKPLDTWIDALAHLNEIHNFADENDPHFQYGSASGPMAPTWPELPYFNLTVKTNTGKMHQIPAWIRKGADVPPPTFGFTPDEAGAAALNAARRTLARGERITLTTGFRLTLGAGPVILAELGVDPAEMMNEEITLVPSAPLQFRFEVESPSGDDSRDVQMYRVPPRNIASAEFAAYDGAAYVELALTPRPPRLSEIS